MRPRRGASCRSLSHSSRLSRGTSPTGRRPARSTRLFRRSTRLVKGRPLVAELKLILTDDTDGEELEASVLGIIEEMGRSGGFSASLLQPLPEALERLSGAWQSVHDAKVALYLS